jgi:hypothetical protein
MLELWRAGWSVAIDSVYFWNDASYELYQAVFER